MKVVKLASQDTLREMAGAYVDRNLLCALLANNLYDYLHLFAQQGFAPFMEKWHEVDLLRGKDIHLLSLNQRVAGNVKGIDQHGHLLLKLEDGALRAFSSGDTTVLR